MRQWTCPCCWSNYLDYGSVEFYDDQCYFPRECGDCWAEWEEWYSMEFIWHERVIDNRLIETFKTWEKQEKLKSLAEEIRNTYWEIDDWTFMEHMIDKIYNHRNMSGEDAVQIYWDCYLPLKQKENA